MRKTDAASISLAVWMLTVSSLMYLFQAPDLKLFIAVAFVGFFIIVYMIHPMFSKPGYIRNLHRMAIVGTALFGLVIVLRALELIEYWNH